MGGIGKLGNGTVGELGNRDIGELGSWGMGAGVVNKEITHMGGGGGLGRNRTKYSELEGNRTN